MERFAAEALEAQRDQAIKAALKANVPWTQLAEDFGMSMEEIIKATERMGLNHMPRKPDDLRDAREEGGLIRGR